MLMLSRHCSSPTSIHIAIKFSKHSVKISVSYFEMYVSKHEMYVSNNETAISKHETEIFIGCGDNKSGISCGVDGGW